jgi:hypothetical protein
MPKFSALFGMVHQGVVVGEAATQRVEGVPLLRLHMRCEVREGASEASLVLSCGITWPKDLSDMLNHNHITEGTKPVASSSFLSGLK